MSRILRSRRPAGYLAGVIGLVMVVGACGDGGERSAEGPPSSTRAAPEASAAAAEAAVRLAEYPVPDGSHPHDVAPAKDGTVWYTAQATGRLGRLDPDTGRIEEVPPGEGSAPHGVIVGPDGAPWITDGGLNAIVRVDPATRAVDRFPLPADRPAVNLNTATFDRRGRLWFTGQGGVYGSVDPRGGRLRVFDAPRGAGPYGITTTPDGEVYYASLAGSHLARVDPASGEATVLEPPTPGQGPGGCGRTPGEVVGERVERRPAGPLRPRRRALARVAAARPAPAAVCGVCR
jgi:streptogramin lyase